LTRFRRARAKALRDRTTDAERRLWRALKAVPVAGTHFRRQVPIGPYVIDFGRLAARLLIELDGGHHSRDEVAASDAARPAWLEREGYRVLRFWNAEVIDNLGGVLDTIYAALHGSLAEHSERFVHQRRTRAAREGLR
jgi:very-short-patch-repair endonuclease